MLKRLNALNALEAFLMVIFIIGGVHVYWSLDTYWTWQTQYDNEVFVRILNSNKWKVQIEDSTWTKMKDVMGQGKHIVEEKQGKFCIWEAIISLYAGTKGAW